MTDELDCFCFFTNLSRADIGENVYERVVRDNYARMSISPQQVISDKEYYDAYYAVYNHVVTFQKIKNDRPAPVE